MTENFTNLSSIFRQALLECADADYRQFQLKLIPTVSHERVIGVRTPNVRKLAKSFAAQYSRQELSQFYDSLPHKYFDEDNLHGELISLEKDLDSLFSLLDQFLPYVDNWATCDTMSPKLLAKYPKETYSKILEWLSSRHTYAVRFGVVTLMQYFLDDKFRPEMLEVVAGVNSGEYYIDMAVAWYMSVALVKQYESALPVIESRKLSVFVHNKSIQKAVESYRIPEDRKKYLKTLKV